MKHIKIDFYSEVIVGDDFPGDKKGRKGVVMGISEENGVVFGYYILFYDENFVFYMDKNYVSPTGKRFCKNDFY